MSEESACEHVYTKTPVFDKEAAKGLSASEIKKRWPRVDTYCLKCGERAILYASAEHYISGDW